MHSLNLSERLLTSKEESTYSLRIRLGNEATERLETEADILSRADVAGLKQTQRRGTRAFNEFVEMNLRLVASRVTKISYRTGIADATYSYDDLFQEGTLGLMKAVEKFDPSKGYRLSTYAVNWIDQYIGRFIFSNESVVKIPPQINSELKSAISKMESDPEVLDEDFINEIETKSNYKVYKALRAHKPLSLDTVDSDKTVGSQLSAFLAGPEGGYQSVVDADLANELQILMSQVLTTKEVTALNRRFGLANSSKPTDGTRVSLKQIGEELSISGEAARKVVKVALSKLSNDPEFNTLAEMMKSNA